MPNITPASFTARGWKEHYSGFPADLFYAQGAGDSPWEEKPHLHVNYAIGGKLMSMTFKNAAGQNTYLFVNDAWNETNVALFNTSPLSGEIAYVKGLG